MKKIDVIENAYKVFEAANEATYKYDSDYVDVVADEVTGTMVIMYHSDNNSFPIKDTTIPKEEVELGVLANELDKIYVGQCF